jgi:hypothetical protein
MDQPSILHIKQQRKNNGDMFKQQLDGTKVHFLRYWNEKKKFLKNKFVHNAAIQPVYIQY